MGLFDNIIWNGAEDVEPLSTTTISDTSPNPASGWSSGWSTGGKKDDSTDPVITDQNTVSVISEEIPEIDIWGDMDFSLFWGWQEDSTQNTPIVTLSDNTNTANTVTDIIITNEGTTQSIQNNSDIIINTIPNTVENTTNILPLVSDTTNISILNTGDQNSPIVSIPSIPATDESSSVILTPHNNDWIMWMLWDTDSAAWVVTINQKGSLDITDSTPGVTNTTTPIINDGLTNLIQLSPEENQASINTINNEGAESPKSIESTPSDTIVTPQIGNLGEITHTHPWHESLAERINDFLKELQALKETDDALLKEKTAEIARLEAEKKELEIIQADRERLNKTIDLLSNIKNI